jgi:DNA-binding transcriptional ArsR family regulator
MRRKPASGRKAQPGPRQAHSLTLTDVHQVKVLADPLRIRILEELCTVERTTKQVAERLGEKPTKLYHHVDALERVGLIRLVRTRQNRGTMEKYYLAVARQFRADSRVFSAADASPEAKGDALRAMITTAFDRTAEEMLGTDLKHGRQFQARLMKLIKSLEGAPEAGTKSGERKYRLTLAFYPLEPEA